MTTTRKRLSGPKKLYRHVGATPVTMKLTPEAVALMASHQDRTGLSRGDLFEWLLRNRGDDIPEGLLDAQAQAEQTEAPTEPALETPAGDPTAAE